MIELLRRMSMRLASVLSHVLLRGRVLLELLLRGLARDARAFGALARRTAARTARTAGVARIWVLRTLRRSATWSDRAARRAAAAAGQATRATATGLGRARRNLAAVLGRAGRTIDRAGLAFGVAVGRAGRSVAVTVGRAGRSVAVTIGRAGRAVAVAVGRAGRSVAVTISRAGRSAAVTIGRAGRAAAVTIRRAARTVAIGFDRTRRAVAVALGRAGRAGRAVAVALGLRSRSAAVKLGRAGRVGAVAAGNVSRRAAVRFNRALPGVPRVFRTRPRTTVVAVSTLVAVVAAGLNSGTLSLFPPGLKSSDLQVATAKTHVMIDTPASGLSITRQATLPQDLLALVKRAELMGQVLVTRPVLDKIAARAELPPDELSGMPRLTADVPLALSEPGSERRAADIRHSQFPYRVEVQSRPQSPILDIYAKAHTAAEAERLADASVFGLREYLRELAGAQGAPLSKLPNLRQLGPARAGVVGGQAPLVIAVLTFILAFGLSAGGLAYALGLRRQRAGGVQVDDGGDWPRTTRVLPWMLAGFIAMLWLTPFHQIELTMSTPIDMTLDRLVLPFVAGLWVLALAAGGRATPRLRMTWIHAAVAAFVVCAFLSVVLDARSLTRSLELDVSLKKLPLLVSYVLLFVIAASAVRRREVRAFLTFTLGLSIVVAVALIYEYRFKQNLFFELTGQVLPSFFTMGGPNDAAAVDSMGRRLVHGPAEVPLEVVTMLSIALPIALVRLLQTSRWGSRIVYGLAACALMAAMFTTFRKSGLLAPVSVVLALAYFRRRELLKLAPLGLLLIVAVGALSPGALGSTVSQFTRSDALSVPTVSDRASDYDAVRPDVWSHLAFGRGWGSYNHVDYRILDSEILHRTIEMGVLGLLAYLMIAGSVVLSARATIASRDPETAAPALIGAAAAVAFLAASTFYDVMSFPHATYIFLYMAGLVAVSIEKRPVDAAVQSPRRFVRRPVVRPRRAPLEPVASRSTRARGALPR